MVLTTPSKVNSDYSFSDKICVVSEINTNGTTQGVLGGHTALIVEYYKTYEEDEENEMGKTVWGFVISLK